MVNLGPEKYGKTFNVSMTIPGNDAIDSFWRRVIGCLSKCAAAHALTEAPRPGRAEFCRLEPLELRKLLSINLPAIPHQIVGNQDPSFAEMGSGWQSLSDSNTYQGDIEYHAAGDGSDTATWIFTGLDPTKHYQFFASYAAAVGAASDAPYTISSDGADNLATVRLNQQCRP